MIVFKTLDFQNLEKTDTATNSEIYINLNSKFDQIRHTWPQVDRCCVAPPNDFDITTFDVQRSTFDNIEKIDCSVDANDFFRTYVEKRKPVFLRGCQEKWRAKNWTIEGNTFNTE